jgi:hypothetical protein
MLWDKDVLDQADNLESDCKSKTKDPQDVKLNASTVGGSLGSSFFNLQNVTAERVTYNFQIDP